MSHKQIILVLVKLTIENGRHIEVSIQANGDSSQDVTGWTMIWTRKPFHDSQLYHDCKVTLKMQHYNFSH